MCHFFFNMCLSCHVWCLPLSFQHWPLGEGPAEMHRLADSLQDGGQGGDGLLDQEDEADVRWAPELVRSLLPKSASGHGCSFTLKSEIAKHLEGRFHRGYFPSGPIIIWGMVQVLVRVRYARMTITNRPDTSSATICTLVILVRGMDITCCLLILKTKWAMSQWMRARGLSLSSTQTSKSHNNNCAFSHLSNLPDHHGSQEQDFTKGT